MDAGLFDAVPGIFAGVVPVAGGGVVAGAVGAAGTTSLPNWANGFGRPVVTSGTSTMLESCRLLKAWSEKMESFNFICLTLNNNLRKSSVINGAPSALVEVVVVMGVEETKLA